MPDRPPLVCGQPAHERLTEQVRRLALQQGVPIPDDEQVRVVLRALADHTALEAARVYDRTPRAGESGTEAWCPTTTSIGRWLHAVADALAPPVVHASRCALELAVGNAPCDCRGGDR